MSIPTESDQSQPAPEPQLLMPESVLRDIAQQLGTEIINRIILTDRLRNMTAANPVEKPPED